MGNINLDIRDRPQSYTGPSLFHQHWSPRGHTFGTCMTRPDSSIMYVNIPKCASSWTKPNLLDLKWEFFNYHKDNIKHKQAMVVLRNPLERWLSGICEYFALYHPDLDLSEARKPFYELVLDVVTFDDHTEKQVYFIEGLDPNKCVYFVCDDSYRLYFQQFLINQGYPNRYAGYNYQHVTNESEVRLRFKKYFTPLLENKKYIDHIMNHYKLDYELINSVQFWRG